MKSAQDQLVLSMAHDLRTPLTGLMTFLEIARKQNSLNECTDYISKAYVKTTQIRDLSNQLFDFFTNQLRESYEIRGAGKCRICIRRIPFRTMWITGNGRISCFYRKNSTGNRYRYKYAQILLDGLLIILFLIFKKYAHPDLPVFLISEYTKTSACITIQIRSLFLINLYTGQALV